MTPGDTAPILFPPGHGDRGHLPGEPCRSCRRAGGVFFVIDDSAFGKNSAQVVACVLCGTTWLADGGLVPA